MGVNISCKIDISEYQEEETVHYGERGLRDKSADKSCRLEMPVCASARGKTRCNAAADQLILINATAGLRPVGGTCLPKSGDNKG